MRQITITIEHEGECKLDNLYQQIVNILEFESNWHALRFKLVMED